MAEDHETRRQELARLMLEKARQDRMALEGLLRHGGIAVEILGFHAQQAVEKALKAVLIRRGIQHAYVHDLSVLAAQVEGTGLVLPTTREALEALTPFAVQFRYTVFDEPPVFEAFAAAQTSEEVLRWARGIVEGPVTPSPPNGDPSET